MGRTVYIDLFFMINFSMDFLCFFLAAQMLGRKMSVIRTVCASIIGGIYACGALFLPISGVWGILLDGAVCVLMCAVAFGVHRSVWLYSLVYFAVSMTLGGFMSALFSLLNKAKLDISAVGSDGISAWVLTVLAIISAALALVGTRFFRRRSAVRYASVSVELFGQTKELRALCDSGNLLRDPISGRACVLVSASALSGVLGEEMMSAVRAKNVAPLCLADEALAKRVRLIPARTATGEGCLLALRPDKVLIGKDGERPQREVQAILALTDKQNFSDGCNVLLPSELLI